MTLHMLLLLIILINDLYIYIFFIIHHTIPVNYPYYLHIYVLTCQIYQQKEPTNKMKPQDHVKRVEIKINVIACDSSTI